MKCGFLTTQNIQIQTMRIITFTRTEIVVAVELKESGSIGSIFGIGTLESDKNLIVNTFKKFNEHTEAA
jgi:hypothetical protein